MENVLGLSVLLLGAVFGGRFLSSLGLSSVTGYLASGLLLGHLWPGARTIVSWEGFALVGEMAIAMIAFLVGGELEARRLKAFLPGVVPLAVGQALGAFLAVAAALVAIGQPIGVGLVLGSIAAATAPSGAILIVSRLKAKGPVSDRLVPVAALDDAVCIVLFAVAVIISRAVATGAEHALGAVGASVWGVAGSLLLGVVFGIALGYVVKYARGGDELLVIVVGTILLASGIASMMHVSPLIASLVIGATVSNLVVGSRRLFGALEKFMPPVYVLLFALAGMGFKSGMLPGVLLLLGLYSVARAMGKWLGVGAFASLVGLDSSVRKYFGLCLLPQAGVAVGLTVAARSAIPTHADMIATVAVGGVLLFELIGPGVASLALKRAGESQVAVTT